MAFTFTGADIEHLSKILGGVAQEQEGILFWQLSNKQNGQALVLTIYNNVRLGREAEGALISVQTHQGYYELHSCTGFFIVEPDEVIFVSASEHFLSSLVVGSRCTVSSFANIRREILSADFSELDPAVLMSAMQLSLAESILTE